MPYKDPEKRRAYTKAYYEKNKEKLLANRITWARENVERRRESANKYARANRGRIRFVKIKSRYGITEAEFWEMFDRQNGRCAGCLTPFEEKAPDVDHCHATGLVRGLLCNNCNRGIGLLKEEISIMKRLIQYLEISQI